jgi:ankyrin repeat protein
MRAAAKGWRRGRCLVLAIDEVEVCRHEHRNGSAYLVSRAASLPFRATLDQYQQQADALFDALKSGDEAVEWRFKWEHPRFRGKVVADVRAATLDLSDAQVVVAREYGFENWAHLAAFADIIQHDGAVARFETAVEAVVSGDVATLRSLLREHPELIHARSARRHHATLLHYVGANGVEGERQKTPENGLDVAQILLDAGAEVDALADMYDEKCTTMSMLVSSSHPHEAGLQTALAERLLDYGAAIEGRGSKWHSALMTALVFGYLSTAEMLAKRGARLDNVAAVAGLGRLGETARLLPAADSQSRHIALALAAQHGHADVVRLLLDAGEDANRYNPDGFHSHSTPMHQAVSSDHADVVRLLADRGARLDIKDTIYQGTPLDWATYLERPAIAEYLRARGAPTT